jgi:hypothetical protein
MFHGRNVEIPASMPRRTRRESGLMKLQIKNVVDEESNVPEENVRKTRDSKSRALAWKSYCSVQSYQPFPAKPLR